MGITMGKFINWLLEKPQIEVRGQGSVNSAGGDSPLKGLMPPARGISTAITVSEALSIAAVYRAISVITTTVSQLPVKVYRKEEEIEIASANSNLWLRQPNLDITQTAFLQQTVFSMATRGNAYWRLYGVNAPGDTVTGIEVLNPAAMGIEYDDDGRKKFVYSGYTEPKTFERWQIKHLKLTEVFGSDFGIGPIQACAVELKGILDLRNYAHNIFASNTFPLTSISVPDVIDPDLAAEYQAAFMRMTVDGKPAVFGQGGKLDMNVFDPAAAQFIDNQQFAITQVSRMFGIPAYKLLAAVDGTSMTYTNLQDANTDYVQDTLMGYINPIEDALSDLIPRGQVVKLKVDALLRASTQQRYTAYGVALTNGFLTPNEVREFENLPSLPGGDELATKSAPVVQANEEQNGATA